MPKYTRVRIEEIRGHLADFASRDGVSVTEFAEEIGVSAWTFYTWRRRFGDQAEVGSGSGQASLLEIESPLATHQPIEVIVGSATVRVPQGVATSDLCMVLQAVRSC
jgi:transposase-like protein